MVNDHAHHDKMYLARSSCHPVRASGPSVAVGFFVFVVTDLTHAISTWRGEGEGGYAQQSEQKNV